MICENNARTYCCEDISNIENYDKAIADTENMWDCHHRVETIMNCGIKELKAQGCYYNRPAHDLIFLTHKEHIRLHLMGNRYNIGKKHSEETRRKMSEAKNGEKNQFFGKHHTLESRHKMSVAKKGNKNHLGKHHSEETRRKMSEARKRYLERRKKI